MTIAPTASVRSASSALRPLSAKGASGLAAFALAAFTVSVSVPGVHREMAINGQHLRIRVQADIAVHIHRIEGEMRVAQGIDPVTAGEGSFQREQTEPVSGWHR